MIQLGISAFYHDSAACLVKDGVVIAAAEEERFTEIKHDSSFPYNAIKWLLKSNNLTLRQIGEVCWYEKPEVKKERVLKIFSKHFFKTFFLKRKFLKEFEEKNPEKILRKLGYKGVIKYTDHHLSHAAFSYYSSPFGSAAILTVDGVGEWDTTAIYEATGKNIEKRLSIEFPNSLGMLYSTITAYLGFKPNEGEYKVMGLAPYGNPKKFYDKLDSVFKNTSNKYFINQKPFTWEYTDKIMFNKNLCRILGIPPRLPEDELKQEHKDLAAALQKIYEYQFNRLLETAKNMTGFDNLCLGGGCAYNGVANTLAYSKFKNVWVPFAPSDAGSAIGACLYHSKKKRSGNDNPFLGPEYTDEDILKAIKKAKKRITYVEFKDERLYTRVAELLDAQNIVAWFQGRMEFGARALGNRSILASPKFANMREKLNHVIKKREGFRPFAPSALVPDANKWFVMKQEIPFMNQVVKARPSSNHGKKSPFPAAVHIDNSARVQTVTKERNERYYLLLEALKAVSGFGVVLNTSFNLKDQTITMSPEQAIERYLDSEIDYLVLNNFLIIKQ